MLSCLWDVLFRSRPTEKFRTDIICSHFIDANFINMLQDALILNIGARCSSVVTAFAHGAMGRRIDPSWGEPIELFLVPASAPRLV